MYRNQNEFYYDDRLSMSSYNGTVIQQNFGREQTPQRYGIGYDQEIGPSRYQERGRYPQDQYPPERYPQQFDQTYENASMAMSEDKLAEKRISSYSDISEDDGQRYCCGCFGSKKNCIRTFFLLVFLIIVGLCIGGYYLWPRIPSIYVRDPLTGNNSDIENIYISPQKITSATADQPFVASFVINMTVFVYSRNYITYIFDDVKVTASLIDNQTKAPIFAGQGLGSASSGRVSFPPSKNTTVVLPFNFTISIKKPLANVQSDPQVYTLLQNCAALPGIPKVSNSNTIPIMANIQIFSKLLSWTGYNPSFSQRMAFPCPPTSSGLIDALNGAAVAGKAQSPLPIAPLINQAPRFLPVEMQNLYGSSSVLMALQSNKRRITKLLLNETIKYQKPDKTNSSKFQNLAKDLAYKQSIPIEYAPKNRLDKLSEGRPNQGMILKVSPLETTKIQSLGFMNGSNYYIESEGFQEEKLSNRSFPLWLCIDNILDPQNLGSILRTCYFYGVDGVVITEGCASLSPVVSKASAGSVETSPPYVVRSLTKFLKRVSAANWNIFGTNLNGDNIIHVETAPSEIPILTSPTLLVVGNEGAGTRGLVDQFSTANLIISSFPTVSHPYAVDSLNVSVASGVLIQHILASK